MQWLFGALIGIAFVIVALKIKDMKEPEKSEDVTTGEEETGKEMALKGHYQAKYLLTKNEWYEYKKLKEYAEKHNLQICPKVRLLDIVEPRRGEANYMSYLAKIKSKHIDFLICDKNLHIKGILELDDNSHNETKRKERDIAVDEILSDVGYVVIRARSVTETTLDPITNKTDV